MVFRTSRFKTYQNRRWTCKYTRSDLRRPIIIQTHISPVPEFIVSQILKHLSFNKKSFHEYVQNHY